MAGRDATHWIDTHGVAARWLQAETAQKSLHAAQAAAEAADDMSAQEELSAARTLFRGHGPGGDLCVPRCDTPCRKSESDPWPGGWQ